MGKSSGGNRTTARKESLDTYLAKRGLSAPISDYMDDKLRGMSRVVGTQKGKDKFLKEANAARLEYSRKRAKAISDYKEQVKAGKIVQPSRIEQLKRTARGNADNPSVQAARRLLKKRYGITI